MYVGFMYYAIVATLMFLFPLSSIAIEAAAHHLSPDALLVAKWYVFWAVGLRLLLAGVRQIVQPRFTAETIFRLQTKDVWVVIRELGFANVSMGVVAIASLAVAPWRMAAALAGGIFYGLAGVNHVLHGARTRLEKVAMASDLFAALVLLGCCAFGLASALAAR
jgi:hypothetical protein